MIPRLIEYSVRHRFLVLLMVAMGAVWGVYCLARTPIDAIPDLSENQVIVFTDWMGRSPQEIDDQITYPLSVNLQGLAGIKSIRSSSEFNFSMINIIFDDSVDFYFARTRVLERLNIASTFLPAGVVPYLAPDTTALGQIFWYTVEGDGYSLDELRALQDWYIRYQLYVPGVAEVSSVGGFVREYQIDVDPDKLRAYDLSLGDVFGAVSRSNVAVGGKVYFEGNAEYLIRGVGWLRGVHDLENVVVAQRKDVPIYVRNIAAVQLGPGYRRSMLEKNDREAVGGVVMMRYGENPLTVTQAIKQRIEQLQSGLPEGVRIVPFYERTRLIDDAIGTLKETLFEELVVASLAIVLILGHLRSAFVVCLTLPLAVLVSFILMYYFGIPSNIMSLSGIAISVGLFVDSAVVMVENTTHELTLKHGHTRIRGDITETTVEACRLVGKPIFFAVLIMLVSFLPVFALGGMEGKMFHPLAFTKSFAMIGVALLSVTFVPAMIPLFVKGKLRREEDSWIVRSFVEIYKPVLNWLLDFPAAGLWFMGFLFIIAAGFIGSSALFLGVLAVALYFGCAFFKRIRSQALALALLIVTAAWAWHFPKLGREFMPPLDEGSILDMPVTVPRVSIVEASEDIRVRDAVLRGFPEVDQVVGKVGRAETPTDPSGIDMVETIVTLRPKAWWPKRKVHFDDAIVEARGLIAAETKKGFLKDSMSPAERDGLANSATMEAATDYDRAARDLARRRQLEFAPILARKLATAAVHDLVGMLKEKGTLKSEPSTAQIDQMAEPLARQHGRLLIESPRREEMTKLITDAAKAFVAAQVVDKQEEVFVLPRSSWTDLMNAARDLLGRERASVVGVLFDRFEKRLNDEWVERMKTLNWELEDRSGPTMVWALLQAIRKEADTAKLSARAPADEDLRLLCAEREAAFSKRVFLWHPTKSQLVQEMDSELQMPGWGNIWTQPIINRVDMLATGVRTMIGVKVFGPRLEDEAPKNQSVNESKPEATKKGIQTISNEIAGVLKTIPGAVDVFPDQVVGRSYLQIEINRQKAARYGVNVSDIQEAIEVAMGGKEVTTTVEGRRRFAVRVRYARDFWQTREALERILVTGRRQKAPAGEPEEPAAMLNGNSEPAAAGGMTGGTVEMIQIPITQVADIRVVEGPSVIKSENGMLRSYVQLNVRDRDIVGFVEEAQRAVADRVKLPPGFFIEWSGQFEHQVRARRTMQIVFPFVILVMFVILYMTFDNVRDVLIVMLAVPGALAGGVIFQSLFGFNFSVAVWIGYIACFGEATQTGIVMLVYLHEAIRKHGGLAAMRSPEDIRQAVIEGAVHRLRPKLMTEGVAIIGLMPMLWATGVGSEVMRPMAAPVLGGLLVADEVIDLLIPVIFNWYQCRKWRRSRSSPSSMETVGS